MPKVSVIIPVYNTEKYLEDCLVSLIGQSFDDIEIICVNDGSTDKSALILEDFKKRDNRIVVINQQNSGAASARNKGLDLAKGEYVSILDSDDLFESNMLEVMYNTSKKENLDTLITYSYDLDVKTGEKVLPKYHLKEKYLPENKNVFSAKDIFDYVFNFSVGWAWDKLYKREFIEKNNLRFPGLQNTEDAFFVFMGLVLAERISVCKDVLITHRINNETQLSNSREKGLFCFFDAIYGIKSELEKRGLYQKTQKSFVNWVMEHTVWQYRTANNAENKQKIKERLIEELYPVFDMQNHSADYFYDKIAYQRMQEIYSA